MQVHPAPRVVHVVGAAGVVMAVGTAARLAPVVAFGGALLLAIAFGRARAWLAVSRLRRSGFEMVWSSSKRTLRSSRGAETVVVCEVRNRSNVAARCVRVRPVASSMLGVTVDRTEIVLPPGGSEEVRLRVEAKRVGKWGIHGLALEVRAGNGLGDGMFEVPLFFANPIGVEVLPATLSVYISSPVGGRGRRRATVGPRARGRGEGDELRELRAHVPGDPFRRIAWKASAKRGVLLSREMERQEEDVLWLILDASVELLIGEVGQAPLDRALEEVSAIASKTLLRGGTVGLVIVASRLRSWVAPASGVEQAVRIAAALVGATSSVDADRSAYDDAQVARCVMEHLRPLDPEGVASLQGRRTDALARRAEIVRGRAPFAARPPFAATSHGQIMRRYLAAFGIEVPPAIRSEREQTSLTLAMTIERVAREKRRPSVIHVFGPTPARGSPVGRALSIAKQKRIAVRWTLPSGGTTELAEDAKDAADGAVEAPPLATVEAAAEHAVRLAELVAEQRNVKWLREHGMKPQPVAPRRRSW